MVPDKDFVFYLLFLIFILLVAIFAIKKLKVEGFSVYSEGDRFTKAQEKKYWDNHNKVLSINSGLEKDFKNVTDALLTTDTLNNKKNKKQDLSFFFEKDNLPGAEEQNLQCSSVLEPRLLPAHESDSGSGCGWWYVDSDTKNSVAARGTKLGPFDTTMLEKEYPGGKWMWDLTAAQKKEDVKRCRKIKTCEIADLVPGRCGFCPALMTGIPVNRDGSSVYSDDPALNCESSAITNPAKCPRPAPPAATPENPLPSVSLPPRAICDPNPATGKLTNECLITLAKGAGCTEGSVIISILSGDRKGYFGQPGEQNERFKIALQTIKSDASLGSPDEFFGFGSCTRSEALGYYNSIVKISASGPTEKSRKAAGFLAFGSDFDECKVDDNTSGPFTLHCLEKVALESGCQPDGSDFPKEIIQKINPKVPKFCGKYGFPSSDGRLRMYDKKACDNLNGNFYGNGECTKKEGGSYSWECRELNNGSNQITQSTKDRYDLMSWGGVINYFRNLYNEMHSSDAALVVSSTKKCLGVDIVEPEADCGDVKGVSNYFYKWDYDYNVSAGGTPSALYYGRTSKEKMAEISNNGPYTPFNIGTDRIFMRVKGKIKNKSFAIETKFWVQTDDGIAVRVNGKSVLQKWFDQGPTAYETSSVTLQERKDTSFEMDWYNNYGGYVFATRLWLNNQYVQVPPDMLQQSQPTGYPIARWDFYEGIMNDRCNTLNTQMVGSVPVTTIDGKKCMHFTGQNYLQITNGIAGTAFKSISMMVYLKSLPAAWPRLWEFNNVPQGGNWCEDSLFGTLSPNNSLGLGFYCKHGAKGCEGPEAWSGAGTMQVAKWHHLVWNIDNNGKTLTMFIDGVKATTMTDPTGVISNKIYKNMYIVNSVEHFDKDIAVAWFRIYDYVLSNEDIKTDRKNGFSSASLFPVNKGSGWV